MKKLHLTSFVRYVALAGVLVLNPVFLTLTAAARTQACGGLGQPACSVSPATFVGKKPSGCPKGSFYDPIDGGTCWSCPARYARHVTSVKAKDACIRPPHAVHKKAKRHGKGRGLLKTDCSKGQFWDPNGYCYSCPRGYARTASKVTARNACAKVVAGSTTHATQRKSLACPSGSFFDLVDGGTCWRCPSGYERTLAYVKAPNACAIDLVAGVHKYLGRCSSGLVNVGGVCSRKGQCGAKGERPCLLAERVPSCNKGLAEDFIKNRCVEDHAALAACMALVDAVWTGKEVLGLLANIPSSEEIAAQLLKQPALDTREKREALRKQAIHDVTQPLNQRYPELKHIVDWMNNSVNFTTLQQLFSAQSVCTESVAQFDARLKRLGLVPKEFIERKRSGLSDFLISNAEANWLGSEDPKDRHFYIGYLVAPSIAKYGGVTGGIMGVTDLRGNGGKYWFVGPQLVSNIGGGINGRVLFFTSANMGTFEGFGWSFGGSVDIKKAINVGADFIFEGAVLDKLIAGQKKNLTVLRGFAIGPGVGLSAQEHPVDVGVAVSYAGKLK